MIGFEQLWQSDNFLSRFRDKNLPLFYFYILLLLLAVFLHRSTAEKLTLTRRFFFFLLLLHHLRVVFSFLSTIFFF